MNPTYIVAVAPDADFSTVKELVKAAGFKVHWSEPSERWFAGRLDPTLVSWVAGIDGVEVVRQHVSE